MRVFTDSTSAFDRPWTRVASNLPAVLRDAAGELDERGDPATPGPGEPRFEQSKGGGAPVVEDLAQLLGQQVSAVEVAVGLLDLSVRGAPAGGP
jgi:hypothetical protein